MKFSGFPDYLVSAGKRLGLPVAVVDRGRRQPAISECSSLLSQALDAHVAHRADILKHARERVDALRVACEACEAMYTEVHEHYFPSADMSAPSSPTETESKPGRRRKVEL